MNRIAGTRRRDAFRARRHSTAQQLTQRCALKRPAGKADGAASCKFDITGKDGGKMKVEVDATSGAIVEADEERWQVGQE